MRLSVLAAAPFSQRQADLADAADEREGDLASFADRVRARLGEGALLRPAAVESHLPERAVALSPFSSAAPAGRSRAGPPRTAPLVAPERPIRLFRAPEPIEVPATEMPEGPPLRFRWRRALHRVARAEGPERLAPEWWQSRQESAAAATRDYYRVEDEEGRRYWLYRQGLHAADAPSPRWFMHGIFP